MIYEVRHASRYRYDSPVDLASHRLHLRPRDLPHQAVTAFRLDVEPGFARRRDGVDHFGNHVSWLSLDRPHASFEITARSRVALRAPPAPPAGDAPPWEAVRGLAPARPDAADFLYPGEMVAPSAAAGDYARASFPPGRPVSAGAAELAARIGRDFAFVPGVTDHSTPVEATLAHRHGVCQDFAHLTVAGLRALGLPARYVSGYVRTRPPEGQPKRRGADHSHAWVGCWLGPDHGWIDVDPTNGIVVGDEHVVLGWGRDYADVSPVRGVILGGGHHRLDVAVDLEALTESPDV